MSLSSSGLGHMSGVNAVCRRCAFLHILESKLYSTILKHDDKMIKIVYCTTFLINLETHSGHGVSILADRYHMQLVSITTVILSNI